MTSAFTNDQKLLFELFKLKKVVPKRKRTGKSQVSYSDVAWFLLDHFKNCKR